MRRQGRFSFDLLSLVLACALLFGGVLALTGSGTARSDMPAPGQAMILSTDPVPLTIDGRDDIAIMVEIATTPVETAAGLMFREKMDDDHGMLFAFDKPSRRSFWMRNTVMPLDIIFVDENGEVDSIRRGKPLDETPLKSDGKVRYVLELKAGQAEAFGIRDGVVLRHPVIGG
ncbi:DUF192 domain-containing protein [Notoacmeibacter sp. MSK16QG-6]|uniref:DUF192 domain-containing protein n=1 Tax=Notoacmeibacter sp. MSK16QG-6 TaxID=2957982 RepID=UPI0020A16E3E|nr:DUF192 domain-containing protein [Notoacmeibacter sp. MSK16QG-6]MCP1197869.1 DUF192 domain-containing protein [Notoacmeibacter sp. MSK16QG-6]